MISIVHKETQLAQVYFKQYLCRKFPPWRTHAPAAARARSHARKFVVFKVVKSAETQGVMGASMIVDELSQMMPRTKK